MKEFLLITLGIVLGYVGATKIYSPMVDTGMIAELAGDSYHIGCKQAEGKECKRKSEVYEKNLLDTFKAIKLGGE